MGKNLTLAKRILRQYTLCDWCLGRQFAMQGYGLTNKERGYALKTLLLMSATELYQSDSKRGLALAKRLAQHGQFQPARAFLEKEGITETKASEPCDICQGVMDHMPKAVKAVIKRLSGWEATSILIGTRVDPMIIEKEEQLRSELQIVTGEPIKAELNREIGKQVTKKAKLETNFSTPDIVAVIQIPGYQVELEVHSLFIYGRYQKLIRGIPQTRWPCRECGGKGCARCKNTGKMYAESVEELIAPAILEMTQGENVKFHGAGREDIDALMLGNGRPFVIEVLIPKQRTIDLEEAKTRINRLTKDKVKVTNLRFANKEVVQRLKGSATSSKKVYKATIYVESPIPEELLQRLQNTPMPLMVDQRTPQRVIHRRVDRVRKKRVFSLNVHSIDTQTLELTVTCQGGLYVKEFISGDEGRTVPSVAEFLGVPAVCKKLDVLEVAIEEEKLPW
ncbi:MAG: tRNA pseudouridine(54/55) synthase Pus10 [Candidatus Thorarchaeota archaeon]